MKPHFLIIASSLILFCCFNQCKKHDVTPTNIVLYDKPLETIQHYIQGKWKLQYTYGGLSAHKYIDTYNSYMILSPEHIIIGNESTGVVADTTIVWVRTDIGTNDFTYLLSYSWSDNPWPWYYIVSQIKNDTLVIRDNIDDGYSYYYTKY